MRLPGLFYTIMLSTIILAYGNQSTPSSLKPSLKTISKSNSPKLCEVEPGIYHGLVGDNLVRYQVLEDKPCVLRTFFEKNEVDIVDFSCNDTVEILFYISKSLPLAHSRNELTENQINTLDNLLEKSHQMACEKNKRTIEELEQMITEPNGEKK